MTRRVEHKSGGKKTLVDIPDNAPDSHARYGIVVGPQVDLTTLGLPSDVEVRLHNELYGRGIFTYGDAKRNRAEIVSALQSVFSVDAGRIVDLYSEGV